MFSWSDSKNSKSFKTSNSKLEQQELRIHFGTSTSPNIIFSQDKSILKVYG